MKFQTLKFSLITPEKDLFEILIKIIRQKIKLNRGDIIVISSKIVAVSEGQVVNLRSVVPLARAKKLAKQYKITAPFAQLIINEADEILGGVKRALLTIKNNILIANAGIDASNSPLNQVTLWPKDSTRSAEKIKQILEKEFKIKLGVMIVDSHCVPLRWGTTGLTLGVAGFESIIDEREQLDIYGKKIKITKRNVADSLASTANFLMGEVAEKTPVVIIKNAPIKLNNKSARALTRELTISRNKCLFRSFYK